jgi:hypothetical protein
VTAGHDPDRQPATADAADGRRTAPRRGWLGLVVARMADDRILIVAAWLTILIATTAMMASAMRSDVVARAAILQVLADAPATASAAEIEVASHPEDAAATDVIVRDEVGRALGPAAGTTWASGISDGFRDPDRAERDIIVFGFADGLDAHARLVDGAWPPAEPSADGTLDAAVSLAAAARLGLEVGDRMSLQGSGVDGAPVAVRIVGRYEPLDRGDPFWFGDPLALDGALTNGGFTTLGPLIIDRALLLDRVTDIWATLRWRVEPDRSALDALTIADAAGGMAALARRLDADLGRKGAADVTTDLPAILGRAAAATQSSGSGILLLDGQVIVLGGYALIMVAAMVVERRRGTTSVLRVRGATTGQLLRLAATEAIVLVVPAVIVAPVLATGLLIGLGALAPPEAVVVAPRLTGEALLLAVIAAGMAIVGMAIPIVASSGPIAAARRSVGRQLSRTAAHRTGLDLAFLAFAAIVLWELRANGAPIAASFRGSVGIDPLLVAAPAIGLAAGAILTLRVVPSLASGLERVAGRRAGVVWPMATRSLARRSSRYSRSALLLVVAVAIAFLAATYDRTWRQSQLDQVAAIVPVDIVAEPSIAQPAAGGLEGRDDAPPSAVAARAGLLEEAGIIAADPIARQPFDLRRPNGRGTMLALVPELAASTVELRTDLAERPFSEQLAAMIDARTDLRTLALPTDATRLRLSLDNGIRATAAGPASIDPAVGPLPLAVTAVVRDATGLLHRSMATSTLAPGAGAVELDLAIPLAIGGSAAPSAPLELLAVELSATIPPGTMAEGSATVTGIEAADGTASTPGWQPLDWAGAASGWTWSRILAPRTDPAGSVDTDGAPASVLLEGDRRPVGLDELTLAIGPGELAEVDGNGLPTLVDRRMAELLPASPEGRTAVTQGFADVRQLDVVGAVDLVPTLDPGRPGAIVDLPTLQLAEWLRGGTILDANAWWISVAPDADEDAVLDRLAAGYALEPTLVRRHEIATRTGDAFQAGVTSVLGMVAGAALLFAVIGLVISLWYTVSSRSGEFAVARALGLGRRQMLGWLAIESGFLIIVGVVGGVVVGLVLAWVVMPSITLTTEGRPPVPPPVAEMAWDILVAIALLGLAAFGLSVLAARRVVAGVRVAATIRLAEADR